jgi:hypothetical protein
VRRSFTRRHMMSATSCARRAAPRECITWVIRAGLRRTWASGILGRPHRGSLKRERRRIRKTPRSGRRSSRCPECYMAGNPNSVGVGGSKEHLRAAALSGLAGCAGENDEEPGTVGAVDKAFVPGDPPAALGADRARAQGRWIRRRARCGLVIASAERDVSACEWCPGTVVSVQIGDVGEQGASPASGAAMIRAAWAEERIAGLLGHRHTI